MPGPGQRLRAIEERLDIVEANQGDILQTLEGDPDIIMLGVDEPAEDEDE